MVTIDINKAFNSISRHLKQKILDTDIDNNFKRWLFSFITAHKGCVTYNHRVQIFHPSKWHTPRCCSLHPSLFNTFTHDIPLPQLDIKISSYADVLTITCHHSVLSLAITQLHRHTINGALSTEDPFPLQSPQSPSSPRTGPRATTTPLSPPMASHSHTPKLLRLRYDTHTHTHTRLFPIIQTPQ